MSGEWMIIYDGDKHILKRRINHPPLIPLWEYSLFSERAIHARRIGFFKEKQKSALGALKNEIKLTKFNIISFKTKSCPRWKQIQSCGLLILKSYHIASSYIEIWNAIVSWDCTEFKIKSKSNRRKKLNQELSSFKSCLRAAKLFKPCWTLELNFKTKPN